MTAVRTLNPAKHDDIYKTSTNDVTTGAATSISPVEVVDGRSGAFTVTVPVGSQTITVLPRVSNDGTNYSEMDNGSGTSQVANTTKVYPWLGKYKYVKCDATASVKSDDVVCTMYVSSL